MKRILLLALIPQLALANCFMRSSTAVNPHDVTSPPTDEERLITPYGDQIQCNVKFKIGINGEWQIAEGHAVGRKGDEDAVCHHAVNLESSYLLIERGTKKLQSEQQMVCYDGPEFKQHVVSVGDRVHNAEVAEHKTIKKYYNYQKTQCRYYSENQLVNGNVAYYQGIMCQVEDKPNGLWQIIDKW